MPIIHIDTFTFTGTIAEWKKHTEEWRKGFIAAALASKKPNRTLRLVDRAGEVLEEV